MGDGRRQGERWEREGERERKGRKKERKKKEKKTAAARVMRGAGRRPNPEHGTNRKTGFAGSERLQEGTGRSGGIADVKERPDLCFLAAGTVGWWREGGFGGAQN